MIKVKAKIIKTLFSKDDYRIFGLSPLQHYEELELNNFHNFSIAGNYPYLEEGKEYELVIKKDSSSKYPATYIVDSVPSLTELDLNTLTREESFDILMQVTSSKTIANNLLDYDEHIIATLVNKGKEAVDLKQIKGVGEVYISAYERQLLDKYKYYYIAQRFKNYKLDVCDCKNLINLFKTENEIENALKENPYYVLFMVLGKSFSFSDRIILEARPELRDSDIRCEAIMIDILNRNEQEGSTRLNGNILWRILKEDYDACEDWGKNIKNIAQNSDLIYYDEDSKDLAIKNTYLVECRIADFIKHKLANPIRWDFEWEKFKKIKEGFLTDEQSLVLKKLCEESLVILNASAGCVDCETEYFNGSEWKKISDYKEGEKVLQYNVETKEATLTYPKKYIKEPCDKMYHFETVYGINQTLSPEHIIPYYTANGVFKTCTAQDLYNKQNFGNGFNGKMITTFSYSGEGIDLTDEEIKLMCAVICDGSFYTNDNENNSSYKTCRFHIKKDRKKKALRELFKELNTEWREKESACEGYTDFYITAPRREKEFTEYWYNCTQHQLQVICDNIIQWDGNIDYTKNNKKRQRFSTNVLSTANFIQFAFSACGYRSNIYVNDRRGREKINKKTNKIYIDKTVEYTVLITDRVLCGLTNDKRTNHTKTKIEVVKPTDNYKYCFTVQSDYLVLRRNNKIFITHNCGKTSSMLAIIEMLEHYHKTYKCITATGKAAKRLSESINNRPTSTIHRACLGDNKISEDVLIVDEHSFLSIELMNMIINSIDNPDIKVLLIGDLEQIPNLSLGKPIRDIVDSGIMDICELTKCFRFGVGGVSTVSTIARQGRPYIKPNEYDNKLITIGQDKGYTFIPFENNMEQIINVYENIRKKKHLKPEDICVITAYNIREFGTINVNNAIQSVVNPPKPNEEVIINEFVRNNCKYSIIFRESDIVMNTINNYNAIPLESYEQYINDESGVLSLEDLPKVSCMNGEIGKILSVEEGVMKIQFDENIIVFDKNLANNLLLAYASNPYKMQGSQCKWVIMLTIPEQKKSLNRQLLYTTLTRAREGVIEIGNIQTQNNALGIEGDTDRSTWLLDLLKSND